MARLAEFEGVKLGFGWVSWVSGALWLLGGVCVGFWVLGLWAGFGWVSWIWLGLLGERGFGVVSLGVSVCGRSRSVGGVFTFLLFGNLLGF